jgi:hypothetical protein
LFGKKSYFIRLKNNIRKVFYEKDESFKNGGGGRFDRPVRRVFVGLRGGRGGFFCGFEQKSR